MKTVKNDNDIDQNSKNQEFNQVISSDDNEIEKNKYDENIKNIENNVLSVAEEDINKDYKNQFDMFEKTLLLSKKYGELTTSEKEKLYLKNFNKEYNTWMNTNLSQISIKDVQKGYFLFKYFQNTNQIDKAENISKKLLYINENNILYDNYEIKKSEAKLLEKKCQKCGTQLPSDSLFCNKCGAELKEMPPVSFCRKCGAKLLEASLFCNKCGTKLKENE